jgi:hypothetical protein
MNLRVMAKVDIVFRKLHKDLAERSTFEKESNQPSSLKPAAWLELLLPCCNIRVPGCCDAQRRSITDDFNESRIR